MTHTARQVGLPWHRCTDVWRFRNSLARVELRAGRERLPRPVSVSDGGAIRAVDALRVAYEMPGLVSERHDEASRQRGQATCVIDERDYDCDPRNAVGLVRHEVQLKVG